MQSSRAIQWRKMIFSKAEKVARNVFHEGGKSIEIKMKNEKLMGAKKKLLKLLQGIHSDSYNADYQLSQFSI